MSSLLYRLQNNGKLLNRIALFSYFTNKYNNYIPLWLLNTARNFYPENSDVFIVTERPENKKYETDRVKVVIIDELNNINSRWSFMEYKLKLNLDFVKNYCLEYDYIANLQSNIFITKTLLKYNYPLPNNKVILQVHTFPYKRYDKEGFKSLMLQPPSSFYIQNTAYDYYIQACTFFGDKNTVLDMLNTCIDMLTTDMELVNQGKYRYRQIAPWHDETYMNRWCVDNKDKTIIQLELSRVGDLYTWKRECLTIYYAASKGALDKQFN